ncbi:acyl-CoA dehydrogenase family protein [Rhodoferax sp.]|uniref:acyl-CoA dehydrogenase family protein n=1 Tax=Rhodoferax sp. TaxID=50421 RepID=UPI002719EDC2|nr:acyl-CoA dehydrogenase family protein [Rhodoferax sp.]MDO9145600.1 acyl-CoA dehydrogenase family protein [Rhodoferax sp.]
MNLLLDDEQQLIVDSAISFLADASPMSRVRTVSETEDGIDHALWLGMVDMGWCGVHLPEDVGGLGLGWIALCLLQEQLGRHLACVPFFEGIAMAATLLRELPDSAEAQALLPELASGALRAVLAMPPESDTAALAHATPDGWLLDGSWSHVSAAGSADLLLLPARAATGEWLLFAVGQGSAGLQVQATPTLDATRHGAIVHAQALALPASACLARGAKLGAALERVRCLAAIALAAEQVGVAQQCLDLTLAYTAQRSQFGKTIAGFQAVKHRCAQMLVMVEAARSAVYGAACMADATTDAATLLLYAAQARLEATQAAQFCARESIQLHGGVGFTWEYDPHFFLRRSQANSQRLGSVSVWLEQVAAQLLDAPAGELA